MKKEYRFLSFVQRWGIMPRHHKQTVAEHSYYVSLYALKLCEILNVTGIERCAILEYALHHDVAEIRYGDTPGPAKRSIMDSDRLEAYHDQFAGEMGKSYSAAMTHASGLVTNYADRRSYWIKDIIKVADILDSVFFLHAEILFGSHFARGLFEREWERLGMAVQKIGLDFTFRNEIWLELNRMTSGGALIPNNDSDVSP